MRFALRGPRARRHWAWAAASVLLLLLLGVVLSFRGLLVASSRVERTTEVELSLSKLLVDLVDAETGQRGYLASGDPQFLDIYQSALSKWPAELRHAEALTVDRPSQQQRLARIESLIDRKLDEMNATRRAYDRGARDGALASAMLVGKGLMDEIRAVIGEMQAEEQRIASARHHARVLHAQRTLALLLVAAFGFAIVVAMVWTAHEREERRLGEQFVAILGHDLRSPLNAIAMTAALLRRDGEADDKFVDRILSCTVRMSTMIGQLLDLARSRLGGGIPIERRWITANDVVSSAVDELKAANPSREIRCTLAPDVRGDWDGERLAQVVSNLVGNAIQHGDPARPVEVRLAVREREAVLEVESFGPPISPDVLPVLFEPYTRRGPRGSGKRAGLGLGLFIADQIVRGHGGRIDVVSTLESGTTFCVRLPWSGAARGRGAHAPRESPSPS